MSLSGCVAVVTGASRGIGRGIALQLGEAGATVYVTGRPQAVSQAQRKDLPTLISTANEITERGGKGIAKYVDHSDIDQVRSFFEELERETEAKIDVLVNNAYSAVTNLTENYGKRFWELDPCSWDDVNNVGLRNHYFCSVYAARMMVKHKSGLIINISSVGGLYYLFNVAYGVGKCAVDRMACDMARELKEHNVTVVALWPGPVKTELLSEAVLNGKLDMISAEVGGRKIDLKTQLFENGETPEFSGKAVVALATDPNVNTKSGRILIAADLAIEYGFKDIDGCEPMSTRSIKCLLILAGYKTIAGYIPQWLRVPGWLMVAVSSRMS